MSVFLFLLGLDSNWSEASLAEGQWVEAEIQGIVTRY